MAAFSVVEQTALRFSVRAACQRLASEERVRFVAFEMDEGDRGFDRELWRTLCHHVGVAGVAVPAKSGDDGYTASAQAVIGHELGRVLAPVPFLSSAVLASAILVAGEGTAELLDEMSSGNQTAAVALEPKHGRWHRSKASPSAVPEGRHWRVSGCVRHVLGGNSADQFVVVAKVGPEAAIFVVDGHQDGVDAVAERVLDGTRPMASVTLNEARAERLTTDGPVERILDTCVLRTMAVLTAEQVGAAERVLEMAVDYAVTRRQFNRKIGSFQAIKHRCADILVELELARSASLAAVQSVDDEHPEAPWRVSMAKTVCSEALRSASHANLQIHGGIGFTWEHAAGLYLKRARTDEVLFGRPGEHWDQFAHTAALFSDPEVDERGVGHASSLAG